MALCVAAIMLGGCTEGGGGDPAKESGPSRSAAVPVDAQDAYCSAVELLAAAPEQPANEASANFQRAAQNLDQARAQITGTERVDLEVKSSLGALVSTVRSAAIATSTGDDAERRKHEASIENRLSEHTADCA